MKYEDSPEATALSRFVWSQRKAGKADPKLEWSDNGRAPHNRSGSRVCGFVQLGNIQGCNLPRKHEVKPTFRTTEEMHPQTLC